MGASNLQNDIMQQLVAMIVTSQVNLRNCNASPVISAWLQTLQVGGCGDTNEGPSWMAGLLAAAQQFARSSVVILSC